LLLGLGKRKLLGHDNHGMKDGLVTQMAATIAQQKGQALNNNFQKQINGLMFELLGLVLDLR